jgi:hypothetical protein
MLIFSMNGQNQTSMDTRCEQYREKKFCSAQMSGAERAKISILPMPGMNKI